MSPPTRCQNVSVQPTALIIGAGVIGAAIARKLGQRGTHVTLLDAQDRSREASWAAGGMLAPHAELGCSFEQPGALFDLGRGSLSLYPALRDELRETTGQDIDLRWEGTLLLRLDEEDEEHTRRVGDVLRRAGIEHRALSASEVRREEPAVASRARGALWVPDHAVDNRKLWDALVTDCRRLGVRLAFEHPVDGVVTKSGRIIGVHARGEVFEADVYVLAAGAWSEAIADLIGFRLPGVPVKGQMLRFTVRPGLLRRVVRRSHEYLVPRTGPELIAGATMELTGFDKTLTEEGLGEVHRGALEILPALARCPVIERWAGLRPRLQDGLPALGRVPGFSNLTVATGHFRNGILLTPITAEVISAVVLGQTPPVDLAPFNPGRFSA
jgi:glycine oxidase